MIDHENHLKTILEAQRKLANEINELSNTISIKREQFTKYQGIVEYLTSNGVKPEENEMTELPNEQTQQ
jgi:predicted double-glycine peptidase